MFWKEKKIIVTHSGDFHPDDVFAVAVLRILLEDKYKLQIIRTRDEEIIKKADYVVDVGMVYDKARNRFDHHQKGGALVRSNGIPYASFGLVWEKFGEEICGSKEVSDLFSDKLVIPIDALDNSISIENSINGFFDYKIFHFIDMYNPTWKEDYKNSFKNFMYLTGISIEIIKRELKIIKDNLEGTKIVNDIYSKMIDKRLLILDNAYYHNQVVFNNKDILLVIFYDEIQNNWCIQVGRDSKMSFNNRISFPENWAGKRNGELEKETGVEGSIFCHKGMFFMVMKSKEGAIEIAKKIIPDLKI